MTDAEFFKGWTYLLVQPWARMYTYGEDAQAKEAVQISIYKGKFLRMDGERWIAVCKHWVEHEDHWPTVSDISQRLLQFRSSDRQALPAPHGDSAPIDYLPRQAYEYAKQRDITITEACRKLMPVWLRDNPNHPERERVEAYLAQIEESLQPKVRTMPAYEEPKEKYEWSTNIKAEGFKGVCPHCKEGKREVLVCWCRREGCRACLGIHMATCEIGRTVNEA